MADTRDDFFSGFPHRGDQNQERFRDRQELEAENARLHMELKLWREENAFLVDLLARRFDAESGEIDSNEPGGEGRGPTEGNRGFTSTFGIADAAILLFEALPELFTLDETLDAAERLDQGSADATAHLRAYLVEHMVRQTTEEAGTFTGYFAKTGRKPYF